ncbi:MAG: chromosome segregation protein SMC [Nitrospiraceae bacterium]
MYLKSLEAIGFKSFAEAKIEFPEGITAVVGPNGSGKSNVVDAILWVLGEQSAKTLRSERMDDVIFNGTQLRKPLGMAEVSLVIGGVDHLTSDGHGLPGQLHEFQELMITRRLYRNGDSEYLINKAPCRLKDIRSLLLDTRAGSKGHTVIEQGRLEQILNASPQDRRELIEETAGIVRYKKQKAEALRKLDTTQQNLLRVRDIVAEVKKQLNSLERQAKQARSYQSLQKEARALEVRLLVGEFRALQAGLSAVEQEANESAARESGQNAEHARRSADLESIKLTILTSGEAIARIHDELGCVEQQQGQALSAAEVERNRAEIFQQQQDQASQELTRVRQRGEQADSEIVLLRNKLSQVEADMAERVRALAGLDEDMRALTDQRAAAVAEEERARRDILNLTVLVANTEQSLGQSAEREQEVAQRAAWVVKELDELTGQRAAIQDRRQTLAHQREEAEQRLLVLTQQRLQMLADTELAAAQLIEKEQQVARLSEELAAADSRLHALRSVVHEEMGYGRQGEEHGTALRDCEGIGEALAERLVVPPGLDRAVEAVLGERVRGWFVDTPSVACQAIEFLKSKELGRGAFIPQSPRWSPTRGENRSSAWWPALAGEPGVVGRAVDLMQVSGQPTETLAYLFEGVVVVESLNAGVGLWDRYRWSAPEGPTLVTLSGELLDSAGVVMGGGSLATSGLLQRRREVFEIEARRAESVEALEEVRQQRDQLVSQSGALREEERRIAEAIREAEMLELSLRKDEVGLQHNLTGMERRVEDLTLDAQKGQQEKLRLEQEVRSGQAQLAQWIREKGGLDAGLAAVRSRLDGVERETVALQQRLTEARLGVEGLRAWREHGNADLTRLIRQQEESNERIVALEQQIHSVGSAIQDSQLERGRQESLCRELGESVARVKTGLVSAQERHTEEMAAAHQIEQTLAEIRHAMSASRETRMAVEVRRAELKTQAATVESTLTGTYQLALSTLLEPQPAEAETSNSTRSSVGEVEEDSPDLRAQLQKIRERLDRMGAINLAAIEEHRALEERCQFLAAQEQDLSNSIGSLKEIIHRINRTTKEMFLTTFTELQQKFSEVFTQFFPGGRAELVLVDEPPAEGEEHSAGQEPGVDIVAQPPGKRLKSIAMLSGGEKTLTAMALLFASFLIRPTPFCILDEIDAPLDEENISRFTDVLRELARGAQFMVITHNKRTMAMADSLFGVTMEEPGISKLVSVHLGDLQLV